MKILVPTKRVPDPDQRVKTTADGRAIDTDGLSFVANPFDLIALEEALRLRENDGAIEVVTVGIGVEDYEKELRTTLAMGADRAILVEADAELDPWNVASALKAVVTRERPDLVLMGKQAVDDDSNQAGQFLAAMLDWPQATFISKIALADGAATIDRETDAGIESASLKLPAVVTVDLRLNEPRYASMLQIMKAKKKPIERIALSDLGLAVEPRIEMVGVEVLSSKRNCQMLSSVDELIQKLRDEAQVI
ncbi:electron transfer flavoprotein subunit beta/FixA family protein [Phycisphaeraceae bacterium D3-23]